MLGYAWLEYFAKPIEVDLRQLGDWRYLANHPVGRYGSIIKLALDVGNVIYPAGGFDTWGKIPLGVKLTFTEGVSLLERVSLFKVGQHWTQHRVFLPYIDRLYPASQSLRLPLSALEDLSDLGSTLGDLVKHLATHPTVVQTVARLTRAAATPIIRLTDSWDLGILPLRPWIALLKHLSQGKAEPGHHDLATPRELGLDSSDQHRSSSAGPPPPGGGSNGEAAADHSGGITAPPLKRGGILADIQILERDFAR